MCKGKKESNQAMAIDAKRPPPIYQSTDKSTPTHISTTTPMSNPKIPFPTYPGGDVSPSLSVSDAKGKRSPSEKSGSRCSSCKVL